MPTLPNLSEPFRKSLLDILKENLEYVGRTTFVHRMVMAGEHDFGLSDEYGIAENFRVAVEEINEKYNEEELTGVLLAYPIYFCLVVDGSEQVLIDFIKLLAKKYSSQIRKFKKLCHFHHVYGRITEKWAVVTGKPPRLIGKLPKDADIKTTFTYVAICVKKLFGLCNYIKNQQLSNSGEEIIDQYMRLSKSFASLDTNTLEIGTGTSVSVPSAIFRNQSAVISSDGTTEKSKTRDYLPEFGLILFILDSPYTTLVFERVIQLTSGVSDEKYLEDNTWPEPQDNVKSIYIDNVDPCTDLPSRSQH